MVNRAATGWLLVPFSLDLGLDIEKSVINRSYARLWDRPGITFLSFAIFFPVFLVDRKWYWKDCYSWCLIPVRSCKRKDKENKSKIAKETVLSPAFLRFLVFAGHFSAYIFLLFQGLPDAPPIFLCVSNFFMGVKIGCELVNSFPNLLRQAVYSLSDLCFSNSLSLPKPGVAKSLPPDL